MSAVPEWLLRVRPPPAAILRASRIGPNPPFKLAAGDAGTLLERRVAHQRDLLGERAPEASAMVVGT